MTTFVLVPGMWIGAWAWRNVTARLRAAGHEVYPLTLTGVADRQHVGGPQTDVVLVGHSYGGSPVTAAADRIPDRIRHLVYVDSGPLPDGTSQLDTEGPDTRTPPPADGWRLPPRSCSRGCPRRRSPCWSGGPRRTRMPRSGSRSPGPVPGTSCRGP